MMQSPGPSTLTPMQMQNHSNHDDTNFTLSTHVPAVASPRQSPPSPGPQAMPLDDTDYTLSTTLHDTARKPSQREPTHLSAPPTQQRHVAHDSFQDHSNYTLSTTVQPTRVDAAPVERLADCIDFSAACWREVNEELTQLGFAALRTQHADD